MGAPPIRMEPVPAGMREDAVANPLWAFNALRYFHCRFDDLTGDPGVRFCVMWDGDTVADYEATEAEMGAWARGERALELEPAPHDPALYPD